MSDDAQTLLSRATPRRANGDPIENEMTSVNSDVLLAAFDEIERLRARVAELERVREAAQKTIERWDMLFGNEVCLPAIDEKFDVLRAALKEAKP